MSLETIQIRNIAPGDNPAMADIIRKALVEFGANRPGTVYYDETTDHLFELFNTTPLSHYLVAEKNGRLIGGAGVFPTQGLPVGTCELVKMYLRPEARGQGLGREMITRCLKSALQLGYTAVYLETMPELTKAVSVYEQFGFSYLKGPMGNSGHNGCGIWMHKTL